MSDNYEQTADWLTTEDTIEETIPRDDGPALDIEVRDISEDELEAIEEKSQQGPADEAEAVKRAIDEYLVSPDVNPENIPMGKRSKLFMFMNIAWSGISEASDAIDRLDIPNQGNR